MDVQFVMPVSYSAWLAGDLGRQICEMLENSLSHVPGVRLTRLPRGVLVVADEDPGPLLEALFSASTQVENAVAETYPVFHHELGPVWTRTMQAVFPAEAA